MADTVTWQTLTFNFSPFEKLKPPLKSLLKVLHTVEAVLEALLALIKAFLLGLLNPLRAIIALLLAAIRAIINQIRATGFAMLVVHPDFTRQDIGAMLASVSGAYPGFERKLVHKFNDTNDIFRPTYPAGSAVAMLIFYIGADSPGDLLTQIFALLQFIRTPVKYNSLPAPVNLKVRPVLKGNNPAAQFALVANKFGDLFSGDYEKALSLEWQMPMIPAGGNAPGFINSIVAFYNSFKFPNFMVERSESPLGETVTLQLDTPTGGTVVNSALDGFNLAKPSNNKQLLREPEGKTIFRFFSNKGAISAKGVEGGLGKTLGTVVLADGALTGTYKFVDTSAELEQGKVYYYRIRAYFGKPTSYIHSTIDDYVLRGPENLVKQENGTPVVFYGQDVVMGKPSNIVRGVVPQNTENFNLYDDVYNAMMAGLLLNFELPPAASTDNAFQKEQKTGWGTLASIGGMSSPYKLALQNSSDFQNFLFAKAIVRKLVNQIIGNIFTTKTIAYLGQLWNDGVNATVDKVIQSEFQGLDAGFQSLKLVWKFADYNAADISSGFTKAANDRINAYLANESGYKTNQNPLDGPFPIHAFTLNGKDAYATADEREKLAQFLGVCLASLGTNTGYLHWYSVTVGDLFPSFIPFLYDIEQFILALLKAIEDALKEIAAIIKTIIQKIQALEQILKTILGILDILSISVHVSVLTYSSTNGGVDDMVTALLTSQEKPSSSPFGLHSGIVLTVGGPGQGAINALKAIGFILGLNVL